MGPGERSLEICHRVLFDLSSTSFAFFKNTIFLLFSLFIKESILNYFSEDTNKH